jgi:hypothetical protein
MAILYGVPAAAEQKTSIRASMGKSGEENERFLRHLLMGNMGEFSGHIA